MLIILKKKYLKVTVKIRKASKSAHFDTNQNYALLFSTIVFNIQFKLKRGI